MEQQTLEDKISITLKCPYRPHSVLKNDDLTINGDYALGLDLLEALKQHTPAEICPVKEYYKKNSDINLVMRGNEPYLPYKNKNTFCTMNICYLYSHLDETAKEEIKDFDVVIAASKSLEEELKENNIKACYIPQFTAPKRFYPSFNSDCENEVLFIGSKWKKERSELIKHLADSAIPISLYGVNWEDVVPQELIKSEMLDNKELYKYYSSAKIVLNQTNPDMIKAGIVSNRIFDVTACKGFVISDYMKEIEEDYGDTIPMYHSKEECVELIKYYLAHPEERKQKAEQAYNITLNKFTSNIAAEKFMSVFRANYGTKKRTIFDYLKHKLSLFRFFEIKSSKNHLEVTLVGVKIKYRLKKVPNQEG